MSDLIKAAHLRCTISIERLYPAWKQANIALDGTPAEKDAFRQWRDKNKAHLNELEAMIGDGLEVDIDAGWPDHKTWKPAEWTETDALHGALDKLEAAQQRIGSVSMSANFSVLHPDLEAERHDGESDEEANIRLYQELQTLYGAQAWAANGGPAFENTARMNFLETRVWKRG